MEIKNIRGDVLHDVEGDDLQETDLQRADLRNADLRGAYLWDADLRGQNAPSIIRSVGAII